jgi:hypothetical protein
MAPAFPLIVAFIGAAAMAPVVLLAALRFAVLGERREFGRRVIKWGVIGALAFALSDLLLGLILRDPATLVGAMVGAAAGFSTLSVSYTVLQRALARRRYVISGRDRSNKDSMQSFKPSALAVNAVLFEFWDPIGVRAASGPQDEYQSYVPQLMALVNRDAPDTEIAEFLGEAEGRAMRLAVSPLSIRLGIATRIKAAMLEPSELRRDG